MLFWEQFDALRDAASKGDFSRANELLEELIQKSVGDVDVLDAARWDLLNLAIRKLGLEESGAMALEGTAEGTTEVPFHAYPEMPTGELSCIQPEGQPGVSLVTCCMNRERNLLRALPSWVECPEITEIVIVDWSSDRSVREVLSESGIRDPRIRVATVKDEPRWVLSYAFNLGFRIASCDKVLKADADIILDPSFFSRNVLQPGNFLAGNWRVAEKGQAYVNGFFYAFKRDLAAVAGFNEYITTYGWDDDDLYERLERHGLSRRDVDIGTIHHLPHSDEKRTGNSQGIERSAWDELYGGTVHKIRSNRLLAHIMPHWHKGRTLVPFKVLQGGNGDLLLQRTCCVPHPVPGHIRKDVDYYAALQLTAIRLGPRVWELERDRLEILLRKPFSDLSWLDVEVALGNRPENAQTPGHYLVVQVRDETLPTTGRVARAFNMLTQLARKQGWIPVVSGPYQRLPDNASDRAKAYSFVPERGEINQLETVDVADIRAPIVPADHARLVWSEEAIAAFDAVAPKISTPRSRIFIDAQHGLGNRMRAIGSAASIAEKTDRELVVVWQPDVHCDCKFEDLFDYDGAVIEESFVDQAAELGCDVYNYMRVEPGAEKDAEIRLSDRNLYARSAYVLNSPHSSWKDQNRFLRGLRPVEEVRGMVASLRSPNDVSAHVRMQGGNKYEHLPFEQARGNWPEDAHKAIAHWREKSHFSHFFNRIDRLIADGRADTIFLAADLPETYAEFKAYYGDRVTMLDRQFYDRSAEQMRYALADVLLLGRAPLLLGSFWSSFTELARRLAREPLTVEMSGRDF